MASRLVVAAQRRPLQAMIACAGLVMLGGLATGYGGPAPEPPLSEHVVEKAPRRVRVFFLETGRGDVLDVPWRRIAATRIVRGDGSRRGCCRADSPWRRIAAPPRVPRG